MSENTDLTIIEIKPEQAPAREADGKHRREISIAIVNALSEFAGLTREQAIATLTALKDGQIPHTRITY